MRHAVVQFVLLTCTVHAVAGSGAVQWSSNGHWYELNSADATWVDAQSNAESQGGHLVTLTTEQEFSFVYVLSGHGVWIGAYQPQGSVEPAGGWQWVTGESWGGWAQGIAGQHFDDCDGGHSAPTCEDGCDPDGQQNLAITWWPGPRLDDESEFGCPEAGSIPVMHPHTIEWSADCNDDGIVDYGQILDGTFADLDGNGVPDCCDDLTCSSTVTWTMGEGGNGHGYQVVIASGGISWTDADIAAQAAGGHLATVGSEAELEFINGLDFGGYSKGWLGGYQNMAAADYAEPDGGWRWVTGEPWSFVGWFSDAPQDDPDRNYLQLAYGQCQDEQDVANEGEWYVIEYGTAESMQWSANEGGNGHYYTTHISTVAWLEANAACQAIGAHLATVTTPEENQFIYAMSQPIDELWVDGTFNGPWLGGYQDPAAPDYSEPGGGWRWVTGEPWIYTNWQPGQPDDNSGNFDEWHLQYWMRNVDTWNDTWVTSIVLGYVLEWSADCNGDGIVDFGQILDGSLEDLDANGVPDCCDDGSCVTVTVAQDGTGDYTTIQEAVDAVSNGQVIQVMAGTFYEHNLNPGGKAITILGTLNANGSLATTIDAQQVDRVWTIDSGEGLNTVLADLVITGGYTLLDGAGILCDNASPTITNCTFVENVAINYGGGIRCFNGSNPNISNCRFTNNSAAGGGGIHCYQSSNPTIANCDFTVNSASESGGAISCSISSPTIVNCTISGNTANLNGGGIYCTDGNPTLEGCTVTTNSAGVDGGGLALSQSSPALTNCIIDDNVSFNSGGGMFLENGSSPSLDSCMLRSNTCTQGGGGAIMCNDSSNPVFSNCIFSGNLVEDDQGGGLYFINDCLPLLSNCTISNNIATNQFYPTYGGGIHSNNGCVLTITGCTITGNSANDGGGGLYSGNSSDALISDSQICGNTPDQIQGNWVDQEGNIVSSTCLAIQWATADSGNDHWYQSVTVGPYLSWQEAWDLATAQGGHLATPVTEEEDLWIINTLLADESLWGYNGNYAYGPHIGGWQNFDSPDYSEPGGGWEWFSGEPFDYSNWVNLDNCCGGQARMQYFKEEADVVWQIGWDDVAVSGNEVLHQSYVIEWSADCNGDGIIDYGQILDGTFEDLNGDGVPDCCDDGTCLDDGDPTTSQWIKPDGGSFHDADNWSTSAPPNQNMTAILEIDAEYTITFEDDAQTLSLLVRNGNITFDIGAAEYELLATDSSALVVGEANGDLATLAIASGQLTSGETLIGRDQGAMGSLFVQGSGTRLDVDALIVGARGEAYLDLSGGARLDTFETYIGNLTGSHGFVSMSGYSAANDTTWNCTSNFTIGYGRLDIEFPALLNVETGSLTINKSGRLAGNGAIHGRMINWGVVEPQWNGPNLELHGTYQQFGLFAANLGSLTDYSTLDIEKEGSFTGWADIKGGLIARLENGFDPPVSSTFSVMNATDGLEGSYSVALMPDLGEEKFMTVVYRYSPLRGSYGVDLVVVAFEDVLGFDEPDFVELVGQPEALVVTDYDNDGDDDIIVSTQGWISIWNNNDTNFVLHQQLDNGGETAVDLVAGYFNEDEWIDIAVANADAGTFAIAINDNGTFTTLVDYNCNVNPVGIAAADFNGDGRDDIAVACAGTYPSDGVVQLWRSQPSGNARSVTFVKDDEVPVGAVPSGIDPGEVEEDKDLDLVVALASEDSIGVLYNNFNTRGGATINFSHDIEDDQYAVGDGPRDIAFKDLDADGYDDIVTANPLDGSISILLNTNGKGDRDFLEAVNLPIGDQAQSVSLTDLDGDGDRDIAVVAIKDGDVDRSLFVLRNDSIVNGNPTGQLLLAPAETFAINGIPILVDDGNIDADLLPDLITINEAGTGLRGERIGSLGLVRHPSSCDGDIDGDGVVNIDDLLTVIETWGPEGGEGDLDGDGDADIDDLLIVISNWGQCSN